mmetsp:Transcript_1716/g.3428  ORF Transcript_1716/g.3428 Transcript_1716/m.3428 type:complete len:311 (+) Transcript_1716:1690-2622(+)
MGRRGRPSTRRVGSAGRRRRSIARVGTSRPRRRGLRRRARIDGTVKRRATRRTLVRVSVRIATPVRRRRVRTRRRTLRRTATATPEGNLPRVPRFGAESFPEGGEGDKVGIFRDVVRDGPRSGRLSSGRGGDCGCVVGGTEAFVRAEGIHAQAGRGTLMGHGIASRYRAFVHIDYGKWDFEALCHHVPILLLLLGSRSSTSSSGRSLLLLRRTQPPRDRASYNPLSHPPVQFGAAPRHLHIHHTAHVAIDFFDDDTEDGRDVGGGYILGVGEGGGKTFALELLLLLLLMLLNIIRNRCKDVAGWKGSEEG